MNKKQIIIATLASASLFGYAQDNNVAATSANQKAQVAELQAQENARAEVELGEAPVASDLIWSERESLFIENFVVENLSETGFSPSLVWTSEAWNNMSGGDQSADTSVIDSLVTLGIDQDLEVLTGIKHAGYFGMTAFWYASNGDLDSSTNSGSSASNIFSSDMTRIFEIYYANSFELENGTVSVRIGQLAADEDFMGVDYAGLFLNSSFGAMPGVASIGNDDGAGFSQYAVATLGFTVAYETEAVRAIFGLYNGNIGTDDGCANHGFDYELQDIAIWYEIGYSYELFGNASYAMFGGNYHSGTFEYANGEEDGFYSFYFGLQQDLIVNADGDAVLGAFFRLGYAPQKIADVDVYLDFGINWFAPLPGRDDDVLGLGFSYGAPNDDFYGEDVSSYSSAMIELTYRCQLTPAIAIQPTAQIYFDARDGEDYATSKKETAYVLGARLEVVF